MAPSRRRGCRDGAGLHRVALTALRVTALLLTVLGSHSAHAAPTPELDARVAAAVQKTRDLTVVYTDPLGEGSGTDPDPRVPGAEVDCMTWVQWVLALATGPEVSAPERLDALRYYGGQVGFRTRKHYLDRWLAWEPGPLAAVDLSTHPARQTHRVELEPVLLRAARGERCRLWREDARTFEAVYLPADDLLADAASWEPGWYVLTGVATDKYLGMYGQEVGPMGQVHLFLLDATAAGRDGRAPADWTLWHASTLRGVVFEDRLGRLLGNTRTIYRGFVPYRVTASAPAPPPSLDPPLEACGGPTDPPG